MKTFPLLALITIFSIAASAQMRQAAPEPVLFDEIGARGDFRSFPRPRVAAVKSSPVNTPAYELERHVFDLLNTERQAKGLRTLVWDDRVAEVARRHSQNMAERQYFSHRGLDGSMVDNRADRLGLGAWQAIGENIAYLRGYDKPGELAVEKWMESTSHRRNLLSPQWSESAVGIAVTQDGTYYFTQVFLLRK